MIFPLILLCVVLVFGVVLAAELLRVHKADKHAGYSPDLCAHRAEVYSPVSRLCTLDDLQGLTERPDLFERMVASRRTALSLYLRELRRDFLQAWNVCRNLAPVSDDPELWNKLLRQYVQFHLGYGVVWLRCRVGFWETVDNDVRRLVDCLVTLRHGAAELLQTGEELGYEGAPS